MIACFVFHYNNILLSMDFLFYIDITLCVQFVIISVFLWFLKKGQRTANSILALFYISISLSSLSFSQYFFEKPLIPHILKIHYPIQYAIAPLFYFYCRALFDPEFRFKKIDILHFSGSIYFFIRLCLYFLLTAEEKIMMHTNIFGEYHYYFALGIYLQFAVYIFIIVKKILRYNQQLKTVDEYSKITRKWLKEFIAVTSFVLVLNSIPIFYNPRLVLLIPLLCSIMYFLILYKIFFEPSIFVYLKSSEQIISDIEKYPNSDIPKEIELELHEKLEISMVADKIFTDPSLTLPGLAQSFQIPYHQLSRFINETYNQNFNDFINSKRIDEVKERLISTTYSHLTIEAIGRSVGFNSKTAFYAAFKKNTNCSPNQYRKAHLESSQII